MKLNISCEDHKPIFKEGGTQKCNCKFLNRNFNRSLKVYFQTIGTTPKEIQTMIHQEQKKTKKKKQ